MAAHYSTKLWRAYLGYLSKYYDKSIFYETCEELGMPTEYILKDDNWVSNQFTLDFVESLKRKTGNQLIARDVGRHIVTPDNLGPIEYELIQSLAIPALVYLRLPAEIKWGNRLVDIKITKFRPGHVRFSMVPNSLEIPNREVCNNLIGSLEGTQRVFNLDSIHVKHDKCIHNDAKECEFEIVYSARTLWLKRLRNFGLVLGLAYLGVRALDWIAGSKDYSGNITNILFLVSYLFSLVLLQIGKSYLSLRRHINQYHEQAHQKSQALHESYQKLERRFQESKTLNELSLALVRQSDSRGVIDTCLNSLTERLKYSRCLVMMLDSSGSKLQTAAFRGFDWAADRMGKLSFSFEKGNIRPGLFADILAQGETKSIFDVQSFQKGLKEENRNLIDALKIKGLIVCPLQDEISKFGLLAVGSAEGDRALNQDDVFLLDQVSRVMSLYFKNVRTLENERNAKNLFVKYVPAVVLQSLEGLNQDSLRPKTTKITSLFVDMRAFTATVETMNPDRVVDWVNLYFDFITECISSAGGVIDKLVGDEVVAFFLPSEANQFNSSRAGLQAAARIIGGFPSFNLKLLKQGFTSISLGMGICSGTAVLGNMGSSHRQNYTAIGDTVNLASRLQGLSKNYSDQFGAQASAILVGTRATFEEGKLQLRTHALGKHTVRGREKADELILVSAPELDTIDLNLHKRGLSS